ncbi:MAG: four helix bundle protein [Magnetococcus sp. YQC-5]
MSHDSFKFAIRSVDETGRMLGGWLKQQEGKQ